MRPPAGLPDRCGWAVPPQDAPTLNEYLEIFDAPINVDLDSEQVWPLPPPLQY